MAARKKPNAVEFIVAELKKNKDAVYADLKAKADKKGITVHPVNYGRAKLLLGLVKAAPRGKGKAAMAKKKRARKANRRAKTKRTAAKRGPGRPKGSTSGVSKSDKIRALLGSGMSGPAIAKKVGCSVNLVYAVKSKSGKPKAGKRRAARKPARARATRSASNDSLEGLVAGLKDLQRERDQLRRVLDKVREVVEAAS